MVSFCFPVISANSFSLFYEVRFEDISDAINKSEKILINIKAQGNPIDAPNARTMSMIRPILVYKHIAFFYLLELSIRIISDSRHNKAKKAGEILQPVRIYCIYIVSASNIWVVSLNASSHFTSLQ
jgi:hypothetical protein